MVEDWTTQQMHACMSVEEPLDVVVVDEVGEDLVGLLGGVVAVPEEVVLDLAADGGGDAVAEHGDLEQARAAASHGGLLEAVGVRVHHHVEEEAVDVHEDEARAGVLGPERLHALAQPGVAHDRDLVVARRAAAPAAPRERALRRHAADGRDADDGDAARAGADEVLEEGGSLVHEQARVGGVVVVAARAHGEVGVGDVVAAGADGEDALGHHLRHPRVPGRRAHLLPVLAEQAQLLGKGDDGGELRRERVESGSSGGEADAGEEVLSAQVRGQVRRQQLLEPQPGSCAAPRA